MAAPLVISISHSLGKEEALRRLKPGLTPMTSACRFFKLRKRSGTGIAGTFVLKQLAHPHRVPWMWRMIRCGSSSTYRGSCSDLRKVSERRSKRGAAFFLRTSRAISVRQSGHQDFSNGIDVED